jgi:hypothetical protein
MFLLGAALAGVVVGRLTRGVVDASGGPSALSPTGSGQAPDRTYGYPSHLAGRPSPRPYDRPVATSLPPAGTATPRPYAPPVDPVATPPSGDTLGTPTTAPLTDPAAGPTGTHSPRTGATSVDEYTDQLRREAAVRHDGPSDDSYRALPEVPR